MLEFIAFTLLAPLGGQFPQSPPNAFTVARLVERLRSGLPLEIDLGLAGRVEAHCLGLDPTSAGGLHWSGSLVDAPGGSLRFILAEAPGGALTIQGVLRRGEEVFLIQPGSPGQFRVREVDLPSLPSCGNDASHRIGDLPETSSSPRGAGPTNAQGPAIPGFRPIVDLLVLYTPAARMGEGGVAAIEALIELAAAETNAANASSGLEFRYRVVHTQETQYTESGNHSLDLSRLQASFDGFLDEAQGLRTMFQADCVMLITDTLNTCGNGFIWNNFPNPAFNSFAYSVVARACAVSNLSFAHELGHNLGCDHEPGAGTGGAFSYARGHRTASGQTRTIMALPPGTRVPFYSSPDLAEGGESLGVDIGLPGEAHNTQSLAITAPVVSGFRNAIPHTIGEGMTTSTGQVFTLSYTGSNRVSLGNFTLVASGGPPGSAVIAFFGFEPGAEPLVGGLLYASAPYQRLPVQSLGLFGEASWPILPDLGFVSGQEIFFQVYNQDTNNPSGFGAALSNGLRVEFID